MFFHKTRRCKFEVLDTATPRCQEARRAQLELPKHFSNLWGSIKTAISRQTWLEKNKLRGASPAQRPSEKKSGSGAIAPAFRRFFTVFYSLGVRKTVLNTRSTDRLRNFPLGTGSSEYGSRDQIRNHDCDHRSNHIDRQITVVISMKY